MTVEAKNEALIRAYRLCFGSAAGRAVLADLAPFCRAMGEVPAVPGSPDQTFMLLGRYEVFNRIQTFSHLLPEEILALRMSRLNPTLGEEDERHDAASAAD